MYSKNSNSINVVDFFILMFKSSAGFAIITNLQILMINFTIDINLPVE